MQPATADKACIEAGLIVSLTCSECKIRLLHTLSPNILPCSPHPMQLQVVAMWSHCWQHSW